MSKNLEASELAEFLGVAVGVRGILKSVGQLKIQAGTADYKRIAIYVSSINYLQSFLD